MNKTQKQNTNSTSNNPRNFWHYMLETIWATGAGVLAAPLATLNQRTR